LKKEALFDIMKNDKMEKYLQTLQNTFPLYIFKEGEKMKKLTLLVLALALIFAFSVRDLKAQASEMDLFVNVGAVTDEDFTFDPFFWSAGINLDINLGSMLMFSPECDVIFFEFKFKDMWLAPGAILNVKYGLLFAGAGVTKWFKLAGNAVNTEFMMKMNAGFKGQKYRIAAYIATPFNDFFAKYAVIFGATLGFRF
jgi:hypothetical protein